MELKPKKKGYGLEIKTFLGKSGTSYLVLRAPKGDFHVFLEVQAKEAARDCGAKESKVRAMWRSLWKGHLPAESESVLQPDPRLESHLEKGLKRGQKKPKR